MRGASTPEASLLYEDYEDVDLDTTLPDKVVARLDAEMGKTKLSPIHLFNDHLDSPKFQGTGLYYEFRTAGGHLVFDGQVEGRLGSFSDSKTRFPLASASKLFTAFATMYTMQLKPRDWHPTKQVNEFPGWEDFGNFPVHNATKRANLTVHHLLTHTSGLPFGMRMSKRDLQKQTLFYWPGTQFGYTLGHRVVGWMLRDYWRRQPEASAAQIETVDDTFRWLFFDKLGLTDTKFSKEMTQLFGFSGQAGDASISSTGEDLMKLAVVALNKGRLPNGEVLISEANWNKWAVPNLLPEGKLSKDLVAWKGAKATWWNLDVGNIKESIMKQHGDYGWNYFGATYFDSQDIGWCGFFSSCLRVTYPSKLAFVLMQRDVADLKKSKGFVDRYFHNMATALQCSKTRFACAGGSTVFCETQQDRTEWTEACPFSTTRGKVWHADTQLDEHHHTCYVPKCHR